MHSNTKYVKIKSNEFSPRLLKASIFTTGMSLPVGKRTPLRYVYDYEMEYYTESKGFMIIENKKYPIKKGDIVLRRPGELVQGILPYNCYLIAFDLLDNTNKDSKVYNINNPQPFQNNYINEILNAIPPVFTPKVPEKYLHLFENIFNEFLKQSEIYQVISKSNILKILSLIYQEVKETSVPFCPHYNKIKKIIDFIENNYTKKITLETLSQIADLSPAHFHKSFKKALNITPNEYIIKYRLDRAKELIVMTELPINQIALKCGFDNIPYFSDSFKIYGTYAQRFSENQ